MKNIYLQYTKIALVAAIAMSTSGVFAWDVRVRNIAGWEVSATLEQAGACQSETLIIPNGGEVTFHTRLSGSCCADLIVVRGNAGPIRGKEARANPPGTGFGISCRNSEHTIKKTANNELVIEQGI